MSEWPSADRTDSASAPSSNHIEPAVCRSKCEFTDPSPARRAARWTALLMPWTARNPSGFFRDKRSWKTRPSRTGGFASQNASSSSASWHGIGTFRQAASVFSGVIFLHAADPHDLLVDPQFAVAVAPQNVAPCQPADLTATEAAVAHHLDDEPVAVVVRGLGQSPQFIGF
jgi:hypothetical protein